MSIRRTLLAWAVASTLITAIVGAIGAYGRMAVDEQLLDLEVKHLPLVEALEDVRFAGLRVVASTSEYVLLRALDYRHDGGSAAEAGDADRDEIALSSEGAARYAAALRRIAALDLPEHQAERGALTAAGDGLLRASARMIAVADDGAARDDVLAAKESFEVSEQVFLREVDRSVSSAAHDLAVESESVRARVNQDLTTSLLALCLGACFALAAGLYARRAVGAPLEQLRDAAADIARGDFALHLPVHARHEIGDVARAFDGMAKALAATTVSKTFLDDIVASMPDGLAVVERGGRVIRVNPALHALLGRRGDEILGANLHDVLPDTSIDGHERSATVTTLLCDEGPVPVAVATSPLTGEHGARGAVVLIQDIRERLRIERALIEARDAAESGTRAKSEFLATMSHELRTPLNAVIGYAELLQEEAGDRLRASDREDLTRIRAAGEMLLHLVDQILDLARLESGRVTLTMAPLPVGPLVREVAAVVGPMLAPGVALEVDAPDTLPLLTTDGHALRQVLLNLTSNACKFTTAGRVRVSAAAGPPGEGTVTFCVEDTGVGMSPEFVQRLFTPFTQAHAGYAGRFAGSGLGLAIAKRMAEALGGSLRARSAVGVGTAFTVTVPVEPPAAVAKDASRGDAALATARVA